MEEYLKDLNEEQYEAATTTEGFLQILAGAGSGKTKTLVSRIAYLVDHGVDPKRILLVTFTKKAAMEMKNRAEDMLKSLNKACDIEATTFHAFCTKMLRIYGKEAGINTKFEVMNTQREEDAVNFVKIDLGLQKEKNFLSAKTIVSCFSKVVNMNMPLSATLPKKYNSPENRARLQDIKKALDKYKEENGLVNFDDLMTMFKQMMEEHEDIRKKIENRYDYIMVDEYQDTNEIQDEILTLMRRDNHNLAVVGDDMQSIYKFRGAEVRNIIHFAKRHEGTKQVTLHTNYRSTQQILNVANGVMDNATEGIPKKLDSVKPKGQKPEIVDVCDQKEETDAIVDLIESIRNNGTALSEICVLSRASKPLDMLEPYLKKEGIDYVRWGGTKFMDRSCIKDVISMLRIISNPNDSLSWFRALQILDGIKEKHARDISEQCESMGYDGVLADASAHPHSHYITNSIDMKDRLQEFSRMDFLDMMPAVIKYYISVEQNHIDNMDDSMTSKLTRQDELNDGKELLDELQEMAEGYDSLGQFLEDISLDNVVKEENDALVLSTIHSVKGLEFDTVIIMDCADGTFPNAKISDDQNEVNEDLRCFYVAVTRAKTRLYFMYPEYIQGSFDAPRLTRFLDGCIGMCEYKYA